MSIVDIDVAHIEQIKESLCAVIRRETSEEILSKYTVFDQINGQAEYADADEVRKAEIDSMFADIAAIRAKGREKRAAVNAATTYEEIAVVVPPAEPELLPGEEIIEEA